MTAPGARATQWGLPYRTKHGRPRSERLASGSQSLRTVDVGTICKLLHSAEASRTSAGACFQARAITRQRVKECKQEALVGRRNRLDNSVTSEKGLRSGKNVFTRDLFPDTNTSHLGTPVPPPAQRWVRCLACWHCSRLRPRGAASPCPTSPRHVPSHAHARTQQPWPNARRAGVGQQAVGGGGGRRADPAAALPPVRRRHVVHLHRHRYGGARRAAYVLTRAFRSIVPRSALWAYAGQRVHTIAVRGRRTGRRGNRRTSR
jgi:hypothetical protein